MFDKLSQQNVRIIQGFISPGESTISPGESTLSPGEWTLRPGESTFSPGESTQKSGETSSGEWAIGRNDRNSSDYIKDEIGTLKELHQFGADNDGSVCSFELCRWNT